MPEMPKHPGGHCMPEMPPINGGPIPTEPVNPKIIDSPPPISQTVNIEDVTDMSGGDPNKNKYEALFKALDEASVKRGPTSQGRTGSFNPADGKSPGGHGPVEQDCPWQLMQQKNNERTNQKPAPIPNQQIPQSSQPNQQQQQSVYTPTTPEASRQIPQVVAIGNERIF